MCFWPLGIPAIVNAAKVDRLYVSGDIRAAERASYAARYWSKWALGVALVIVFAYVFVVVVAIYGAGA